MSIQWTAVACYLYLEVAAVTILMLPIASPRRWRAFFRSRLFAMVRDSIGFYFYMLLGVLGLFLIDAIREMRKYSHGSDTTSAHLTTEMKGNIKLFRAQRNFYITSFAVFLAFVIRRIVTMILIQAELLDKSEIIVKEAEAAKDLAKSTVITSTLLSAGDMQNYQNIKNQLEMTENLLEDEKNKTKELQEQANEWKLKYQELLLEKTEE